MTCFEITKDNFLKVFKYPSEKANVYNALLTAMNLLNEEKFLDRKELKTYLFMLYLKKKACFPIYLIR